MAEPTTARDALIAEVLRDVLQLKDTVEKLPSTLATAMQPAADRSERAAGAILAATEKLIEAGNRHQSSIAEYVDKVAVPKINRSIQKGEVRQKEASSAPTEKPPDRQSKRSRAERSAVNVWVVVAAIIGFATGFVVSRIL